MHVSIRDLKGYEPNRPAGCSGISEETNAMRDIVCEELRECK
jgi:hypothetical protein